MAKPVKHDRNTTKKNGKKNVQRDEKGKWLPGTTVNPYGRPRKENAWADIYRQILDSKEVEITLKNNDEEKKIHLTSSNTIRYALGVAMITQGFKGNVQAIKEMADRECGRPPQHISGIEAPSTQPQTIIIGGKEIVF